MRFERSLLLAAVLLIPPCARATIHRVPEDFDTIQQAIDAARTQDTVLVSPGTYYENLTFQGKALTLGSLTLTTGDTTYVSQTVVDGSEAPNPDSASTLYICEEPDTLSQVVGFTITGGRGMIFDSSSSAEAAGIAILRSNVLIRNCHIVENGPVISGGGLLLKEGNVKVQDTRFVANVAGYFGAAFVAVGATVECIGCEICDHEVGVDICVMDSCDFVVRDCQIHHNTVLFSGLTILSSSGRFTANKVFSNTGGHFTFSLITMSEGEVNIDSNEIWQNEVGMGTVSLSYMVACSMRWNYIHDNISIWTCAGIEAFGQPFPTYLYHYIFQNSFVGNTGLRAGAVYISGGRFNFVENYFEGNEATEPGYAGVVSCIQPHHIIMRRNVIEHNDSLAVAGEIIHDLVHWGVDAVENFWGHPSGPHHPVLNPDGLGNAVGDCVRFIPWLLEPPAGTDRPHAPSPIPQAFGLLDPYPNPFNPGVTLPLSVTVPGDFKLEVFDLLGRLIWSHTERFTTSGIHRVYWPGIASDGRAIASGIYFARTSTKTQCSPARKLVLLK